MIRNLSKTIGTSKILKNEFEFVTNFNKIVWNFWISIIKLNIEYIIFFNQASLFSKNVTSVFNDLVN